MTADDRATILVVDDDQETRDVLVRILAAAGFLVVATRSRDEATAWLADHTPQAFILAADSPTVDGVELCCRLREQARFRTTPILTATASEDRYLLRAAFTAGCDDFLLKPLEPLVVVARIGGLMKKAEYFRQLEEVRSELSRYVSPRIRKQIEWRVDARCGEPAPALLDVCILFTDIRGFTALSQAVQPTELFRTVSRHLGAQVDSVYRHHGYVDKFAGDGLMAIFDGDTMAVDACQCALEMMRNVRAMEHPGSDGPVPAAIGIHSGSVVVGNIGSGEHLDYTAIGETVNIAARLCGQAASERIIVSENLRRRVGQRSDLRFVEPETVAIRGLTDPIVLYQLQGADTA